MKNYSKLKDIYDFANSSFRIHGVIQTRIKEFCRQNSYDGQQILPVDPQDQNYQSCWNDSFQTLDGSARTPNTARNRGLYKIARSFIEGYFLCVDNEIADGNTFDE